MTDLELNKAVAEAYKVPEYASVVITNGVGDFTLNSTPLYQDHGRIFELCVEHGISVTQNECESVSCRHPDESKYDSEEERFEDHTSELEATCICILEALARLKGIEYD